MPLVYYLIIFTVSSDRISQSWPNYKCQSWSQKHIFISTERHYYNITSPLIKFSDFDELNVRCPRFNKQEQVLLTLYATRRLMLDNSVDLRDLLKMFVFSPKISITLMFMNIKGFNQKSEHYIGDYLYMFDVNIVDLDFQFYKNDTLIDASTCQKDFFEVNITNFFGSIRTLYLDERITYSKSVCPYVFMNTQLKDIAFYQMSNSLIFKNQLEFLDINENDVDLRTEELRYLQFTLNFDTLSLKLINKHVFKNLMVLYFAGIIYSVEDGLFNHLRKLRLVIVSVDNLREFFHAGTRWITQMNFDLNVDLNNRTEFLMHSTQRIVLQLYEKSTFFNRAYTYPDEDICLYKDFPHRQLIYPSIIPGKLVKCSCTIMWLLKYSGLYLDDDWQTYSNKDYGMFLNYPENFLNNTARNCLQKLEKNECKFNALFKNCLETKTTLNKFSFEGIYNNLYRFQWMKYIFQVYFQPVMCLLGICTNLLTVIVLSHKKKLLQNSMYKHLMVNSLFNLLYCFINVFALMNICIFSRTSYCSKIYKKTSVQYFKIYVIISMGNALRLCSNLSYITLSISRFYLSTSRTSFMLKKLESIKLVYFYMFLFVSCVLLSIFKVFEFKINEIYAIFDKNFPYDAYGINYCEFNYYNSKAFALKCKIFPILNLINNILNNIIFIFMSVVIDISLVKFSNTLLEHKRHMIKDEKHLYQIIKYKQKLNKLIITNGTIYFFSHVPEFVTTLLLIIYKKELANFCYYFFSCTELIEIAQTFSFISMSLQFFIFIYFDHNFRCGLLDFAHTCHKLFQFKTQKVDRSLPLTQFNNQSSPINEISLYNEKAIQYNCLDLIMPNSMDIDVSHPKQAAFNQFCTLSHSFFLNFHILNSHSIIHSKASRYENYPCNASRSYPFLNMFPFILKSSSSYTTTSGVFILHCGLCNVFFMGQTKNLANSLQALYKDLYKREDMSSVLSEHFARHGHNIFKHFSFWILKGFDINEPTI